MTNTYIQDKLLEKHICRFNDGECNCDCYIAGMKDYHNHIVENIKEPSDIRKARFESDGENTFDYGYDTKTKEILSLLQDTNPKE